MTRRSLRLRLALAGAGSIIAALVAAFFVLSTLFERHVERRIAAELVLHLNQVIMKMEEAVTATGEKPIVIGHSVGGLITQVLANKGLIPGLVKSSW